MGMRRLIRWYLMNIDPIIEQLSKHLDGVLDLPQEKDDISDDKPDDEDSDQEFFSKYGHAVYYL